MNPCGITKRQEEQHLLEMQAEREGLTRGGNRKRQTKSSGKRKT